MVFNRKVNQTVSQEPLEERYARVRALMWDADAVLIGAGAGLSTAAGIEYSGPRFTENFQDFIARYGMTDMYSSSFYPFETEEEKWAYWSRHIRMNRYDAPVGEPYKQLLRLVRTKPCFVITTNVDAQFYKAGFDPLRIWAVQGDYGKFQCARGCHDTLYDNHDLILEMCEKQKDCRIPSELVPHCPRCGEPMEINIRKDEYFVQDEQWYAERGRYMDFLEENKRKKVVFLELGVGFNTPTIIRFPFEQMAANWPQATLVRIGRSRADIPTRLKNKGISLDGGIRPALDAISKEESA